MLIKIGIVSKKLSRYGSDGHESGVIKWVENRNASCRAKIAFVRAGQGPEISARANLLIKLRVSVFQHC